MPDLTPDIEQQAAEPAAATSDGQSATARPIGDLIEADRYLKGNAALSGTNANGGPVSGWKRTRPARAVPPGAV